MKEANNNKENLIDDNKDISKSSTDISFPEDLDIDEGETKRCCLSNCCFYLFCCCCCHSDIKSNEIYQKNWKNYLYKEGQESSNLPFNKLTRLFANADEEAIQNLYDFRLNPNLVNENKLRNDLEFYIPQLCTFFLFGDIKAVEETFSFFCKVCNRSFFFAHRVHWFLSAMINAAQEKKESIINILQMINTVYKSQDKKARKKIEKFYIANSEDFIKYIEDNNLYFFYDAKLTNEKGNLFDKINFDGLNGIQQEFFNKYKKSRDIIIDYSNKEFEKAKKKEDDKKNKPNPEPNKIDINLDINNISTSINSLEYKFKSSEFLISLSNFTLKNIDLTYIEDSDPYFDKDDEQNNLIDNNKAEKPSDIYNEEKIDNNFVNINKSLGDINFISYHSTLNFIEHLCDISNELPNHPIEEQMVYLYQELNEINKILPCNVYLPFLKDSTRNYFVVHIPLDGARIFRTRTRCPLMLTFEIVRIDEINEELKEEQEYGLKINLERNKSIVSQSGTLLKDKITSIDLQESKEIYTGTDFDLSKPVTLIKKPKGKNEDKNKNKKGKILELENHESSPKKKNHPSKNEESLENTRISKIIKKFKLQNPFENDRNIISRTIFEPKVKNPLEASVRLKSDSVKKLLEDIPEKEEDFTEEKKKKIEEEMQKEEAQKVKNTNINLEELRKVFGESFEQKGKNIKKKSLFGKMNTHKIFRCIIKTHEDLRQEQFATQLINEFYQIYQLEKTDLWLNTYEIISTGNDSGLVEMVNDSLSLDQLKHKIDHISLSDFFIHYFGNGDQNSHLYKKAMKNYISSLAGYSLVCYFLQIKDRHNGNILIDNKGHLIHIDFGFLLSNSPGKGIKFETAPFKLSKDMIDAMGGYKSKYYEDFKKLMKKGFQAVNKHRHKISILVEMMWCGHGKNLDCFEGGQNAINELKQRLNPKDNLTKKEIDRIVDDLINQSAENWRTKVYDMFQSRSNGIFY